MQCMCVLGGQLAVWVINTPLHYTDGNWIVAQTLGMEMLGRPNHPQPRLLHEHILKQELLYEY